MKEMENELPRKVPPGIDRSELRRINAFNNGLSVANVAMGGFPASFYLVRYAMLLCKAVVFAAVVAAVKVVG